MLARLLTLAIACAVAPPLSAYGQTAPREWNQDRGNAGRTAYSSVEPITATPVEIWRESVGTILAGPVSWGGVVYVIAMLRADARLYAFDVRTGESRGVTRVASRIDAASLAVSEGIVVVVAGGQLRTFEQRGNTLKSHERIKGNWSAAPCIFNGVAFVTDLGKKLWAIDVRTGDVLASQIEHGDGAPAACVVPGGGLMVAVPQAGTLRGSEEKGSLLVIYSSTFERLGTGEAEFVPMPTYSVGELADSGKGDDGAYVARFAPEPGKMEYPPKWILGSRIPPTAHADETGLFSSMSGGGLLPITSYLAIRAGSAYGFSADGGFIQLLHDGRYTHIVEAADLPPGAHPGPTTIARGVAYLGNWAVEIESKRVLWCLPDLNPVTPLAPVLDEHIVCGSGTDLVGLASPGTAVAGASPGAERFPPGPPPGSGDGVVLASGRRIAGAVTRKQDGTVAVTLENGEALEFAAAEVALVESGGSFEHTGSAYPVFVAWRDALHAAHVKDLLEGFERNRRERQIANARRLLVEARLFGAAPGELQELEGKLTGKKQDTSSNADKKRDRLDGTELQKRKAMQLRFEEGAAWLAQHGMDMHAIALYAQADRLHPGKEPILDAVRKLMPRGLAQRQSLARTVMDYAQEIIPVDGEFLEEGDPEWKRIQAEPWTEGILAFRTPNLLLVTRARSPEVVGDCLRNGEATVRALDRILGVTPAADRERLDVRLHRNRAEYLAEQTPSGNYAIPWSAGYYSPQEGISRFYVSTEGQSLDPLGRGLYRTLSHELTHHYISRRWLPSLGLEEKRMPATPGMWVIEGFARFIEDQILEADRLGGEFEDTTVRSIEAAVQAHAQKRLIKFSSFVDMTAMDFHSLSPETKTQVRLTNTLAAFGLSDIHLFYEQAGTLAFFLMNRRGPEGRAALLEYMKAHYSGTLTGRSWTTLGFKTARLMEREFHAFLEEL